MTYNPANPYSINNCLQLGYTDDFITEQAKLLFQNVGNRDINTWDASGFITHDFYRRQIANVLCMAHNHLNALMQKGEAEENGVTASGEPPTKAAPAVSRYNPEAIFGKVKAIREQRTAQYRNSRVYAHQYLGQIWTGIINSWLQGLGSPIRIPIIPGWVTALMFVALKISRVALAPDVHDSYIDMVNYSAISEECAVQEGELTDV